ncbi:MAG: DUF1850 domain-containing protein [Halobacteriales archaeon SW_9_67_25]|jgi:hypothetical protein|nr:MAG: DUF1850 domain-containing protein [Halobacteriales archaeon SW_9_67_25]
MNRPESARARLLVPVVLALAVVLAAGVGLPADRTLVVERVDTGERVITQPVGNGTTVALEYTHSVEKSRVYDGYTIRGEKLEMTRMEFESYGWGLPADANVTREDGRLVYDPDGSLAELSVAPGEIAGHRLHVGDRTYDLVERSEGNSVRIYVERQSYLDTLL